MAGSGVLHWMSTSTPDGPINLRRPGDDDTTPRPTGWARLFGLKSARHWAGLGGGFTVPSVRPFHELDGDDKGDGKSELSKSLGDEAVSVARSSMPTLATWVRTTLLS